MPDIGSYWYDRHGGPDVVRVVADDNVDCTFLLVNSILTPSVGGNPNSCSYRLDKLARITFYQGFQGTPCISSSWLGPGSTWFNRHDAAQIVIIEAGSNDETTRFRAIAEGGARAIEGLATLEFLTTYVRVDEEAEACLTGERFWVVGHGICAVFTSRWEAQEYAFTVGSLLSLPDGAVQVVERLEDAAAFPIDAPLSMSDLIDFNLTGSAAFTTWSRPGGVRASKPSEPRQTLWERLSDPSDDAASE